MVGRRNIRKRTGKKEAGAAAEGREELASSSPAAGRLAHHDRYPCPTALRGLHRHCEAVMRAVFRRLDGAGGEVGDGDDDEEEVGGGEVDAASFVRALRSEPEPRAMAQWVGVEEWAEALDHLDVAVRHLPPSAAGTVTAPPAFGDDDDEEGEALEEGPHADLGRGSSLFIPRVSDQGIYRSPLFAFNLCEGGEELLESSRPVRDMSTRKQRRTKWENRRTKRRTKSGEGSPRRKDDEDDDDGCGSAGEAIRGRAAGRGEAPAAERRCLNRDLRRREPPQRRASPRRGVASAPARAAAVGGASGAGRAADRTPGVERDAARGERGGGEGAGGGGAGARMGAERRAAEGAARRRRGERAPERPGQRGAAFGESSVRR